MEVWKHEGRFHTALMIYTAVMVPLTDFLTAVVSSLIIYGIYARFFSKPRVPAAGLEPVLDK